MPHEMVVLQSDRTTWWRYLLCTTPSLPVFVGLLTAVVLVPLPEARSGWWQIALLGVAVWAVMVAVRMAVLVVWTSGSSCHLTPTSAELRWRDHVLLTYDDVIELSWGGRAATTGRLLRGGWWAPDLPHVQVQRPGRVPRAFPGLLISDDLPALPPPR